MSNILTPLEAVVRQKIKADQAAMTINYFIAEHFDQYGNLIKDFNLHKELYLNEKDEYKFEIGVIISMLKDKPLINNFHDELRYANLFSTKNNKVLFAHKNNDNNYYVFVYSEEDNVHSYVSGSIELIHGNHYLVRNIDTIPLSHATLDIVPASDFQDSWHRVIYEFHEGCKNRIKDPAILHQINNCLYPPYSVLSENP